MALAKRVKQLRTEHHWSQGGLAQRIDADPAQINRYENDTHHPISRRHHPPRPNLRRLLRLPTRRQRPRRPFTSPEDALSPQLHDITELNPDDLELVTRFIDALVTKTRLKTLTNTIN